MRVLVAMSGGVDSSVAAARLVAEGHEVVGVTMKLWGGESDTGCCSVADVDDARRVAQQLGVAHHVWNFGDDFEARVVAPYVDAHRRGATPNPCIECNRHLKFDRLLRRAVAVGFDAVATGHHARVVRRPDGSRRLARGADAAKDQSYVLYVLGQRQLARTVLPVGATTKEQVRVEAEALGLRTADKPDSQDVCFVTSASGRAGFLGDRLPLRPGRVVDAGGRELGQVPAVELVTVGQRRGLGLPGGGAPRYAVDVDVAAATVRVGGADDLLVDRVVLDRVVWAAGPVEGPLDVQCSAHGAPHRAVVHPGPAAGDRPAGAGLVEVRFATRQRRVAPGQSVVLYDGDEVVGGGSATAAPAGPGPT
ncbi:MAG TPA: tRNA 2-thiouridine(34) synthase MnmA [Acidimicrobiales bacterium]|nr:tRNA 2-thiouridine(34) synthase MnmA [Acidimicrobiales bacterium]